MRKWLARERTLLFFLAAILAIVVTDAWLWAAILGL